jgi:hypothetical protein
VEPSAEFARLIACDEALRSLFFPGGFFSQTVDVACTQELEAQSALGILQKNK